jgi:hypothetical protein
MPPTLRRCHEGSRRCGSGVEADLFARASRHHPNDAPQQTSPNPDYRMEEQDPLSPVSSERRAEGERTNAHVVVDLGGFVRRRPVAWRGRCETVFGISLQPPFESLVQLSISVGKVN